jgi:uncharacterized protein YndB with AHSA1/START domain
MKEREETQGQRTNGSGQMPPGSFAASFSTENDMAAMQFSLPPLHLPGARSVVRDRHERLVSMIVVPDSPRDVWQAIVDPAKMAKWLGVCSGDLTAAGRSCLIDFEDGEFFFILPTDVTQGHELTYITRWLGIGHATQVTWRLTAAGSGTQIEVIEIALNPAWDWQTWNGGGWPGILDQLAAYLRTGRSWRWPWRRMGPYVQIELPVSVFAAWDQLFSQNGLKYWLLAMSGSIQPGASLPIMMGDASGTLEMNVEMVVQPGQMPPSFMPFLTYRLKRPAWGCELPGRIWLEPAGWGKCHLQAFHMNWEGLPGDLQLSERKILTGYWAEAAKRALQYLMMPQAPAAPHNW